jgi:hypothetical protein
MRAEFILVTGANRYYLFDHSYFIDNSTNQDMKLVAEFKKKVLDKF